MNSAPISIFQLAEDEPPRARFPAQGGPFRVWQTATRHKLAGWLMNGGLPVRVPLATEILETTDHPVFTLHRVRYRSQSDRSNTLLIALPKHTPRPAPLLLALHGHEAVRAAIVFDEAQAHIGVVPPMGAAAGTARMALGTFTAACGAKPTTDILPISSIR